MKVKGKRTGHRENVIPGTAGQNGNYLSELEAQPGGPEGRPHTTAGSKPIPILGRPQGVRPRSPDPNQCDPASVIGAGWKHPVPGPVSFSRTHPATGFQLRQCAGVFGGADKLWFNHARYDYVIEMLCRIFIFSVEQALAHAQEVDATGRTRLITCELPAAEYARDQIHGYGADWRMPRSKGSMSAEVEPAS